VYTIKELISQNTILISGMLRFNSTTGVRIDCFQHNTTERAGRVSINGEQAIVTCLN